MGAGADETILVGESAAGTKLQNKYQMMRGLCGSRGNRQIGRLKSDYVFWITSDVLDAPADD